MDKRDCTKEQLQIAIWNAFMEDERIAPILVMRTMREVQAFIEKGAQADSHEPLLMRAS